MILRLSLLTLVALPAQAHVHTDPIEVTAGTQVEIALEIGHGCAGAPTTGLRLGVPFGLQGVTPVAPDGWTATASATEIAWTGGILNDRDHGAFTISATVAPDAPDPLLLPVIQICSDAEHRWIETDENAGSPAPRVRVLAP